MIVQTKALEIGHLHARLTELPMEFAVEAQKRLAVSLEGREMSSPVFLLLKQDTAKVATWMALVK